MTLTTFGGHPVVKCESLRDAALIARRLQEAGLSVRIKIIKAKPRRHNRHFLVFPFRSAT
jgi:hypothetical protein